MAEEAVKKADMGGKTKWVIGAMAIVIVGLVVVNYFYMKKIKDLQNAKPTTTTNLQQGAAMIEIREARLAEKLKDPVTMASSGKKTT